ncbi:hypothetical protein Q8A73_015528 [Channa argus]|nr:hypothetical protein Q8A73_015528 [Channa argus]
MPLVALTQYPPPLARRNVMQPFGSQITAQSANKPPLRGYRTKCAAVVQPTAWPLRRAAAQRPDPHNAAALRSAGTASCAPETRGAFPSSLHALQRDSAVLKRRIPSLPLPFLPLLLPPPVSPPRTATRQRKGENLENGKTRAMHALLPPATRTDELHHSLSCSPARSACLPQRIFNVVRCGDPQHPPCVKGSSPQMTSSELLMMKYSSRARRETGIVLRAGRAG